jgi:hypothetical protein
MDVNLLVVVISCHKHMDKWEAIIKKNIPNLIIVIGGNKLLVDEPVVQLKCSDKYEGLPEKIICMIEYVIRSEKYKNITHILKIDDNDAFFTKEQILSLTQLKELQEYDYIGQQINRANNPKIHMVRRYHIDRVPAGSRWYHRPYTGDFTDWADGGCSYILSRFAMEQINTVYKSTDLQVIGEHEILEDVMIAKILRTFNIFPRQLNFGLKTELIQKKGITFR